MKELCWNCKGHGKLISNQEVTDCWMCDNTGIMPPSTTAPVAVRALTMHEKYACDIMEYCNAVSYDIFVKYDTELMQRYENLGKIYSLIQKRN